MESIRLRVNACSGWTPTIIGTWPRWSNTGAAALFENLTHGPTVMVGDMMRLAAQTLGSMTRNEAVNLVTQAQAAVMRG